MMNFEPPTFQTKSKFADYVQGEEYGCGYSFANVYLWGDQRVAFTGDRLAIFATFGKKSMYHYPIGRGELQPVIESLVSDAKERGIEFRLIGINERCKKELESVFPDRFVFNFNRDTFDYIYKVDDLAQLKGKKYHGKRNHLKRFDNAHPNATAVPLNGQLIGRVKGMVSEWYESRLQQMPDQDLDLEKQAIFKAIESYDQLGMDAIALMEDQKVLAVTLGYRMTDTVFDVSFEKAIATVDGAYTKINHAFANYIRAKYPQVKFINREEDMGILGLRKAKESYYPDYLLEKYSAKLKCRIL